MSASRIAVFPGDGIGPEVTREAVQVLKSADLNPLDVTSYGTRAEREVEGHEIGAEDIALMDRALAENAVIVAETTVLREDAS